jgi:hypothetical protein
MAQTFNRFHVLAAQPVWAAMRRRAAIEQLPVATPPAPKPAMRRPLRDSTRRCRQPYRHTPPRSAASSGLDHEGQTRILVDVHSGNSADGWLVSQPQLLSSSPREQPSQK